MPREKTKEKKEVLKNKVTSFQEEHDMVWIFEMQCLARIPLLGDFVAENKEKLSPIKKNLYLHV